MVDEQINSKLAVFQGKHIRRILHNEEWWFAVIDIIEVLTDSSIPKRYWSDLKRKLSKEGYSELYEKIVQLKLLCKDIESHTGKPVVSGENFKELTGKKRKKMGK